MVSEISNEKDEEEDISRDEAVDILNIRSVTYQISFSYFCGWVLLQGVLFHKIMLEIHYDNLTSLDDFVDVTRDEMQIMHSWNSFVRKHRIRYKTLESALAGKKHQLSDVFIVNKLAKSTVFQQIEQREFSPAASYRDADTTDVLAATSDRYAYHLKISFKSWGVRTSLNGSVDCLPSQQVESGACFAQKGYTSIAYWISYLPYNDDYSSRKMQRVVLTDIDIFVFFS